METVFLKLLNMSITGCVMILAVIAARLLLKKAPRWSICLLWGLVAVRLICPFTVKSNLSLIRNSEPITQEIISEQLPTAPVVTEQVQHEIVNDAPEKPEIPEQTVEIIPEKQALNVLEIAGYVWLSGVSVMLAYSLISYLQLKHRVRTSTRLEKNIRQSEYVSSPFVLGMFRPIIYLPYGLKQKHQDHIIAHERSHIGRGDHLIKPLGFAVLAVHWFNPLVWVAYILLCRDIEAACDERVISKMTLEQRQSYSATLLHYSVKRCRIAACPVAFSETGIKGRIKNVMNYKKPTVWLIVMSMLLSLLLAGCFMTDPLQEEPQEQLSVSQEDQNKMDALVNQIAVKLWDMDSTSLHPDYYRIIDTKARQELMAYGDKALEYFISQLRTTPSNMHSVREQIMVYICEDLAKVIPAESRYNGGWSEIPGMWLTYYDMKNADQDDQSGLQPGFYYITDVLYGDPDRFFGFYNDGRQYMASNDGRQQQYMVTENGFFLRYIEKKYTYISAITQEGDQTILNVDTESGSVGEKNANSKDYTESGSVGVKNANSKDYTTVLQVNWNWQPSGTDDDLWSKLSSQERDEYKEYMGLETLLAEKDYLYQPLDENHCLIQTDTGLYTNVYLIGQSKGQLQYIYQLMKKSTT